MSTIDIRPAGAVGLETLDPGAFPYDAWELDYTDPANPVLRLKAPWRLSVTPYAPVAGEPSAGTLHHLPLNVTTISAVADPLAPAAVGNWSAAVDCSSFVPVGTKAVLLKVVHDMVATNVGNAYSFLSYSDNNSNTPSYKTHHPMTRVDITASGVAQHFGTTTEIVVPLSTSRTFYVYTLGVLNINSHSAFLVCIGYYL